MWHQITQKLSPVALTKYDIKNAFFLLPPTFLRTSIFLHLSASKTPLPGHCLFILLFSTSCFFRPWPQLFFLHSVLLSLSTVELWFYFWVFFTSRGVFFSQMVRPCVFFSSSHPFLSWDLWFPLSELVWILVYLVIYPLSFLTAYKMTSRPSVLAWPSD